MNQLESWSYVARPKGLNWFALFLPIKWLVTPFTLHYLLFGGDSFDKYAKVYSKKNMRKNLNMLGKVSLLPEICSYLSFSDTHIPTYTHARTHTQRHTHVRTHTVSRTHTYMHKLTQSHTHTHAYSHLRTHTHTHTLTLTLTCTHTMAISSADNKAGFLALKGCNIATFLI